MQLLTECLSAEFAQTDAAVACLWLKRRKGTVLPLAFTAIDQAHYATSEDGALLTVACSNPGYRPALCRERVMNSGWSCAEVTMVRAEDTMIGVGRPTLDVNVSDACDTTDFWGMGSALGSLYHNGESQEWQGMEGYGEGDVLRMLLDSDAGTLTAKKNGTLLGVAVTNGLTGDLCWVVAMGFASGSSVRIKALDPAEF